MSTVCEDDIVLEPADGFKVGGTYTFELRAELDDVVWDITSATVTLYLRDPNSTLLTKSATVTDGPGGIAQYTTLTTDLDEAGIWGLAWKVSKSGTVLECETIDFMVDESLGG